MTRPAVGAPAPDFRLPATGGQTPGRADFRGRNVVLDFYPKDNTPGCTMESQGFRDRADEVACNAFDVLQREWRGVKVPGHVDEVLAAATGLAGQP